MYGFVVWYIGYSSRVSGVLVEYITSYATRGDEIIDVAALGILYTIEPSHL